MGAVLLLAMSGILHAASPGGVDGTVAWFRTEPFSTGNGEYVWHDTAGDSIRLLTCTANDSISEFRQPGSRTKHINFNPALDFSISKRRKYTDQFRVPLGQSTIIGVYAPYDTDHATEILQVRDGMGGIDRAWLDSVGGMLESVTGQKTYTYPYITEIGYDRFGQRSYMKHGNGAVTRYEYDDVRRLCHLDVTAGGNRIIDNDYSFDPVGNVTGLTNNAPLPGTGSAGGRMTHTYGYDTLYRLSEASGQYTTAGGSAGYLLSMTYDAMHRITRKQQSMTRTEAGAAGAFEASYTLDYMSCSKFI